MRVPDAGKYKFPDGFETSDLTLAAQHATATHQRAKWAPAPAEEQPTNGETDDQTKAGSDPKLDDPDRS